MPRIVDCAAGTKSLVLVCHDSDVPSKPDNVNKEGVTVPADLPRVDFFHWVLVDLDPAGAPLAEGEFCDGITPTGKDGSRKYTVQKGESFYSIARKIYRDPGKWTSLYKHNKARLPRPSDPSSLRVGTVIALPNLASSR